MPRGIRIGEQVCSVEGCDKQVRSLNLCNAHYQRMYLYGRTERAYGKRVGAVCSVDGCEKSVKGKGLCPSHYQLYLRYGKPEKLVAKRITKHPLYIIWWQRKKDGNLCEEWKDFSVFVDAVGERPAKNFALVRLHDEPYGPNNFEWREHLQRKEGESIKAFNARQWASQRKAKPLSERARHYPRNFGITLEQYEDMVKAQNNLCAICEKPELQIDHRTGNIRRLAVDHNHKTKKVRDLLCRRCNQTIGHFEEDLNLLEAMKNYLIKHKE